MRLKLLSTTTLVFLGLLISGCNEKENKSESITKEIVKKEVKKEVKSYILRDSNSTIVIKESNKGFKFYNIDNPVV